LREGLDGQLQRRRHRAGVRRQALKAYPRTLARPAARIRGWFDMIANRPASHRRTIPIWLTASIGLLLVAWIALVLGLVSSGVVRVETPLDVTWLQKLPTILLALLVCLAALSLLWLRRIASSLFLCALALDLLIAASHLIQTGWSEELWGPGSVLKLIIHAYLIAASVYTFQLRQFGRLE
jgi:hypothetical protein